MAPRLITMLGTGDYHRVRWHLLGEARHHESCYAPAATAALAGTIGDVAILLTAEAEAKHGRRFREEMAELRVPVRSLPIPSATNEEGIWRIFSTAIEASEGADEVVLDVTHAFRHLPLVLLGSLQYLGGLRALRVGGVYYGAYEYGAFEDREGHEAPLLDLGPLVTLGEWAYAVRSLRETGNSRWLTATVTSLKKVVWRLGRKPLPALDRLKAALDRLEWAVPAGLPLEAGLAASGAMEALDAVAAEPPTFGPLQAALDRLRATLAQIAISGAREKASVRLDQTEIERQLRLARLYDQWGQQDRALLLLREWIVNRGLLAANPDATRWLDYGAVRLPQERALNGLAERVAASGTTSDRVPDIQGTSRRLASRWQAVTSRRNAVAHAGFKPETVEASRDIVGRLIEDCARLSGSEAEWRTEAPGHLGRVLVTPLGHSPGVLFTALIHLTPDSALIITSPESRRLVDEACGQASYSADRVTVFTVPDAHTCFDEVGSILDSARPLILGARELVVSITGGTTAMQYLAERVAGEATRLGIPTQRYAMIDRRSAEAQREEPYVLGTCLSVAGDAPPAEVSAAD
jgi:CRISPR-associated DxTHG motif protein